MGRSRESLDSPPLLLCHWSTARSKKGTVRAVFARNADRPATPGHRQRAFSLPAHCDAGNSSSETFARRSGPGPRRAPSRGALSGAKGKQTRRQTNGDVMRHLAASSPSLNATLGLLLFLCLSGKTVIVRANDTAVFSITTASVAR